MSIYNDAKGAVLEQMDVELFLTHLDPDWSDHYKVDKYTAFELVTAHMSPDEIQKTIKESGCME